MTGYHVESFGCRASQADGDAIAAGLEALGASPAERGSQTDVVVVNTCTVTAEADRDARAYIRRIQRQHPQARILVTGCYAQRAPEEVAALPGVFAVVGNSHKNHVSQIALAPIVRHATYSDLARIDDEQSHTAAQPTKTNSSQRISSHGFIPLAALTSDAKISAAPSSAQPAFLLQENIFAHSEFQLPSLPASVLQRLVANPAAHRTRPTLKIQDGCGNRCTFCIIPSTRGNSRSLPRQQVLDSVEHFIRAGGQELVISGINLGRWGRDLTPQTRLEDLLTEIFESTRLPRLRISSVEPMDWTDGLIGLLARWGAASATEHPRLARHVHMPLQSGSDAVLRRMHRRYRPWHYAERLAKVRAACPQAAIGADVMVGFPGETEEEFRESYDFIAAQPLTYLHLFPFSARPGTPGWDLHRHSPVPAVAVQERMAALRELIAEKNLHFRSQFIGRQLSAVTLVSSGEQSAVERTSGSPSSTVTNAAVTNAMADNFLPVEILGRLEPNLLVSVKITGLTPHGLSGTPVQGIRSVA